MLAWCHLCGQMYYHGVMVYILREFNITSMMQSPSDKICVAAGTVQYYIMYIITITAVKNSKIHSRMRKGLAWYSSNITSFNKLKNTSGFAASPWLLIACCARSAFRPLSHAYVRRGDVKNSLRTIRVVVSRHALLGCQPLLTLIWQLSLTQITISNSSISLC